MESLPEEIIIQILAHLEPQSIIRIQATSRRFASLGRDESLWKRICFDHSRHEVKRRCEELLATQEPSLVALRRAMNSNSLDFVNSADNVDLPLGGNDKTKESTPLDDENGRARKAYAYWDPSYPAEYANFHDEFRERFAPITVEWLEAVRDGAGSIAQPRESVGMAVAEGHVVSPLDDGSVCIWNVRDKGKVLGRSTAGLINAINLGKAAGVETGAVDNVCVDSVLRRAYIAVATQLHEIDLSTLQLINTRSFPFSITALSKVSHPLPITIGTDHTLHLHDTRSSVQYYGIDGSARCELISGPAPIKSLYIPATSVALSQPGPLSILHLSKANSSPSTSDPIWVGGRFTSLLEYDRRYWPRISSTLFSGARISSLAYLPYPYISRALRESPLSDLHVAKDEEGMTLIAAGAYKGKGSLELYGLPRNATSSAGQEYRNRQTASRSRLLSVTPHGMRIVFSDGDGNLKWMERDGFTLVREFNINTDAQARTSTMFPLSESEGALGDIVQKIVATENDLVIWTGDGRLGLVGFGQMKGHEEEAVALRQDEAATNEAEEVERYARRMREALEHQAHEARFVRNLGFGY